MRRMKTFLFSAFFLVITLACMFQSFSNTEQEYFVEGNVDINPSEVTNTPNNNGNELSQITEVVSREINSLSKNTTGEPVKLAFISDNTLAIFTSEGIWFQELSGENKHSFELFSERGIKGISREYFTWIPQTTRFLMAYYDPVSRDDRLILLDTEGYEMIMGPPILGGCSRLDIKLSPDGIVYACGNNVRDTGWCRVTLYDVNTFSEIGSVDPCSGGTIATTLSVSPDGSKLMEDYKIHSNGEMIRLEESCLPNLGRKGTNWSSTGRFIYQIIGPNKGNEPCVWLFDVENNFQPTEISQALYPTYNDEYEGFDDRIIFSPTDDRFALVHYKNEVEGEFVGEGLYREKYDQNCYIKIFDTISFALLHNFQANDSCEYSEDLSTGQSFSFCSKTKELVWSKDGKFIAFLIGGDVKVLDVGDGKEIFNLAFEPSE
jgi:hypothetical protein